MKGGRRSLKYIRATLTVVGLVFFVGSLWFADWGVLSAVTPIQLLSMPFFLASVCISGVAFWALRPARGASLKLYLAFQIESWLVRYVPGPSQMTSKFVRLLDDGTDKTKAGQIVALDTLSNLTSSALVSGSVMLLFLATPENPLSLNEITFTLVISMVVVSGLALVYSSFGLALLYSVLGRIVFIIAVLLVVPAQLHSYPDWGLIPFVYLASAVVGYAAVFVPGGLGVRETAFVAIASAIGVMEAGQAIALAALFRMATMVADSLLALIVWPLTRLALKKKG